MPRKSRRGVSFVLDTWAVLAWLAGEISARRVERELRAAEARGLRLYLSVINAGEVYYRQARAAGVDVADRFLADLRSGALPIQMADAHDRRVCQAARLKAKYPIAYADAFAGALAQELDLPVLTGDPDFRVLEQAGECRVEWLPRS
jgi:ribonuclease VapC